MALAARRHAQPRRPRARARLGPAGPGARAGRAVEGHLDQPRRLALLQSRALRVLTQGHLSQHILFHSLHQNAIPDNAPAIFGVASREEFQTCGARSSRRCRSAGSTGSRARTPRRTPSRRCATMLERGVRGQAIPAVAGAAAARPPAAPAPALAAADALQRPAAAQAPARVDRHRRRTSPTTRRSAATAARSPGRATRPSSRSSSARGEIGVLARGPAGDCARARRPPACSTARTRPTTRRCRPTGAGSRSRPRAGNLNFAKRYGRDADLRARPGLRRHARDQPRRRPGLLLQPGDLGRRPAGRL